MNKKLLIGLLAGAAAGAAILYVLYPEERDEFIDNLKGLGRKAKDLVTDTLGMDEDEVDDLVQDVADEATAGRTTA